MGDGVSSRHGEFSHHPRNSPGRLVARDTPLVEELPRDMQCRPGYRIAYGEAAPRRDGPVRPWVGSGLCGQVGEAEAIEREVIRRVSHTIHPELVKLAVADAREPRKPRW